MYAIIKTGGKQYRVSKGDALRVETLDAAVGDTIDFDQVLMVGEGEDEIGRPAIVVGVKSRQQLAGVPRQVEGVRVMGWVVGEVDALGNPPRR